MTRFAVLDDERGLILGLDSSNMLKKGVVYELKQLLGEIVVTEIGENTHGKIKDGKIGYGHDMNVTCQMFLPNLLMTKAEEAENEIKT